MKSLVAFSLFIIACLQVTAQTKTVNLQTYAPRNPTPDVLNKPEHHDLNGDVRKIEKLNSYGGITERTYFNKKGFQDSVQTSYAYLVYQYSKNGREINVLKGGRYGGKFYLDEKGRITAHEEIDMNGTTQKRDVFVYDSIGNLIQRKLLKREQVKKGQYSMKEKSVVDYEYDSQNRVIKEKSRGYEYVFVYKVDNNQLNVTVMKNEKPVTNYWYDDKGLLQKKQMTVMSTVSTEDYSYLTDREGNILVKKSVKKEMGMRSEEGFIIHYADGTVSKPAITALAPVNPARTSGVYSKLASSFQSGEGFIDKGILNGPGMYTSYGITYQGAFVNGQLDGYGSMYDRMDPSSLTIGIFKKGKLNGYGIKFKNNNVAEAGVYKEDVLVENLAKDYLASATKYRGCQGNCTDGFGLMITDSSRLYTFYKKGKSEGPYINIGKKGNVQKGAIMGDVEFIDGLRDGQYCFGFFSNKRQPARIFIRSATASNAGVYSKGAITKQYEIVTK